MEGIKVIRHLVVMVMCFGFSVGMCSDSDVLIKSYVSFSLPSGHLVVDSVDPPVLPSISKSDWNSLVLGSKIPVVVLYTADWCGLPCYYERRTLISVMPEFTGRAEFYSLDYDEGLDIAKSYGISAIPTIFFFRDGDKKDSFTGRIYTLEGIREFIESNM